MRLSLRIFLQSVPEKADALLPENICHTHPPAFATARIAFAVVSLHPAFRSNTSFADSPCRNISNSEKRAENAITIAQVTSMPHVPYLSGSRSGSHLVLSCSL